MSRIVIARVDLNQILFGAAFSLPSQLGRCTKKKLEEKLSILAGTFCGFLSVKTSRKKIKSFGGKIVLRKKGLVLSQKIDILSLLAGKFLRF